MSETANNPAIENYAEDLIKKGHSDDQIASTLTGTFKISKDDADQVIRKVHSRTGK